MKAWHAIVLMAAAGCAAGQRPAPQDEPAAPAASPTVRHRSFEFPTEPAASASASGASSASPVLDKDSVRQVIRDRYTEIRACYEPQLKRQPNLKGTVIARFMIGEDGSVASVDMTSSKLPSTKVVDCVGQVFSTMKFPRPANGMILITYPIQLMPEVTTEWQ